ncbi:MAG: hypothetical protein COW13_04500 [Candidatus Omnitrophica bacterium CG12_big_fil_rev_8_21_14_0_65_50_5]|nr:MAG: hypothetical protein COW13_04500 [Candidatus Omnitrophica bacterium CG12_big_fil_rev_8_21_14_0_65_50_5]
MKSNVLTKDRKALTKLCQSMNPEQRLTAFLNHSRCINQFYRAGEAFRSQLAASKKKNFLKT